MISYYESPEDSMEYTATAVSPEAQNDYLAAALRSIERGSLGIHHHDAFEIAVKHNLPSNVSTAACFIAAREAGRILKGLDYLPNELPEGWIDELE